MRIRLALTEDEDVIVAMARRYHAEAAVSMPLGLDERVVRRTMRDYLATANPTIFVAEKPNGHLVGLLVASIQPYLFQSGLWTHVEILYVQPENRGTRAAPELIAHFDAWSRQIGALMSIGGNANMIHTDRTASLYRKFGYQDAGKTMVKFRSP